MAGVPEQKHLTNLRKILDKRFDEGELQTLCFDLGVDFDNLPGDTKAGKATALVGFLERHGRVPELVEMGKRLRPDASWDDMPDITRQDPTLKVDQAGHSGKNVQILMSDVVDNNLGIERIWPDRDAWQLDHTDGLLEWRARVCRASRVEIMSNTLWQYWMRKRRFRQALLDNIAQGASVHILLYDPNSQVSHQRAKDEEENRNGEMQQEIRYTLSELARIWDNLGASAKGNLAVRLTTWAYHLVQLIRADELMLIGFYLSGMSGGESPTMQLRGPKSAFFVKYARQFNIMWRRGKHLSDEDLYQILEKP